MICARSESLFSQRELYLDSRSVHGLILLPKDAFGLVVMAYGDPTTRSSPVHQYLAGALRASGMAVCLVDLVTPEEADRPQVPSQPALLANRIEAAMDVLSANRDTCGLPVALLGANNSAAAVLAAADRRAEEISTVVCCCGRPDRADIDLNNFSVPTLLIVPGKDKRLVKCNEEAFVALRCPSQLAVILGAGPLFSEAGTVVACEYVVRHWCEQYLRAAGRLAARVPETR